MTIIARLSALVLVVFVGVAGAAAGVLAPINDTCPVTNRPVNPNAVVTFGEYEVAACCNRCVSVLRRWSDEKKQAYVAQILNEAAPRASRPAAAPATRPWTGDPYPLPTCPVAGEKLDGSAVVHMHNGREFRFCCNRCVATFKADPEPYVTKVDEAIVKNQTPFYPMTECMVFEGESLFDGDEDIAVNLVHNNRLVRLCCKLCARRFQRDPAKYVAVLDQAVIKAQRPQYPVGQCLVSGNPLPSGDDIKPGSEIVVGNRLVRFCCPGCVNAFRQNPASYLATLDRAWKPIHRRNAAQRKNDAGTE